MTYIASCLQNAVLEYDLRFEMPNEQDMWDTIEQWTYEAPNRVSIWWVLVEREWTFLRVLMSEVTTNA